MKTSYTVVLSMLAGAALGAISVGALHAQAKAPGAYLVVGYTDIDDIEAYKANVSEKAQPLLAKHGGRVIVATNDFTVLREGPPPFPLKRYALIGFDTIEQAKDYYNSADRTDIRAYIDQHTKGRAFAVKANPQ